MVYEANIKYTGNKAKEMAEDALNNHLLHDEVTRKQINDAVNGEFQVYRLTWLLNKTDKYGKLLLTPNRLLNNHDIVTLYKWFESNYDCDSVEIVSDFIFEPNETITIKE